MSEEIAMSCWLPFSSAAKYGLIKIDMEHTEVKTSLKSSLSEEEKKEIWARLFEARITNIHPDHFYIIHCPWFGLHVKHAIDFDISRYVHAGQYSSKEGWER
jgi:hypothetical protein